MTFKNQTAIITGGASGIGRALGNLLAQRGATVVLADRNAELAEKSAEELHATGGKAQPWPVDVTDADAVQEMVEGVARQHGHCDYLFNNAGISIAAEVRDMALSDWNRILDVNLRGVIHGVHAAYPLMIRQGHGHIINTASIAGLAPFPLSAAYATTKHAVVGLSTSLRAEAAGLGVRVSVVCPGFIDTPLKDSIENLSFDMEKAAASLPFKLHAADACARDILRGVARNKAIITVTPEADLLWHLYRMAPDFYSWVSQFAVEKSRTLRKDAE